MTLELLRAIDHVRLHRGKVMVFKVGGACLQKAQAIDRICRQVAAAQAFGARPVLVHGGGPQTSELQRLMGEEPRMVDGRRVTSETALSALRMSLIGELNGDLVARLARHGARAFGSAASSCVRATRRPPMKTSEGPVDFGLVGDVTHVDPRALRALLEADSIPVLGPPAADGEGGFLNVNADLLAAEIAIALGAHKLVLLTSASGIQSDPAQPASVVSTMTLADLRRLRAAGAVVDGMHVKSKAIERALEGGVPRVHVVSGMDEDSLLVELYTNQGAGTLVTLERDAPLEGVEA